MNGDDTEFLEQVTKDLPTFERQVTFRAAYDRRDPDPGKNYGVHGVEIRFVLIGPKGAAQFLLYTNWMLPHVQKERDEYTLDKILAGDRLYRDDPFYSHKPMAADLGYHAREPRYEGQKKYDVCDFIEGGCYYDGSTSNAEPVFDRLLHEGEDGVWAELEDYYRNRFGERYDDEVS
jgi:hypothetical protein